MAARVAPAAATSDRTRCTPRTSGVVWVVAATDGGNPAPSVPTYAVLAPSADAALASSQAQVVLPLVPVTPAIDNRVLGDP